MKTFFSSRAVILLLVLAMCLSFAACGNTPAKPSPDAPENSTTVTDEEIQLGFGLVEDFEVIEELDENPDQEIVRASTPIKQNVLTKLDGTCISSDAYLYRSLLSDTYKQAYDLIRAGILEGKTEIQMTVPVAKADIQRIYRSVFYDCPDLFWMEGGYSYSYNNSGNITVVKPKYNDLSKDIAGNTAKLEAAVSEALADMWSLTDPAERVKYAHDYLTYTIDYDFNSSYNQTAFSALVNKKSVCAGYSRAFQYMMQKMDIRCGYIVGTASSSQGSGSHAWNIVELGGEFYAMDVTWDDPIGSQPGKYYYTYFNLTDSALSADHTRGDYSAALPAAVGTAKSFASAFDGKVGTDFAAINGTLPEGYGKASTAFIGEDQAPAESNPYLS